MSKQIKPCGGKYDAPLTLKEAAEYVGCSWQHVQYLEVQALHKITEGLKIKAIAPSDCIQAFREGAMESQAYEDALILAVAEDLGLPEPTSRYEDLGDTLRALFEQAGYERRV